MGILKSKVETAVPLTLAEKLSAAADQLFGAQESEEIKAANYAELAARAANAAQVAATKGTAVEKAYGIVLDAEATAATILQDAGVTL